MDDNSVTHVQAEVVKGSGRTVEVRAIRTSRAKIQKNLTSDMIQASENITQAYEDLKKGWGYALLGIPVSPLLRGSGGIFTQDMIDKIRKNIGKLHEWEFQCVKINREWLYSVRAIEREGLTANEYSRRSGFSVPSIMDWYRKGLNEYCVLQGWGQQLD